MSLDGVFFKNKNRVIWVIWVKRRSDAKPNKRRSQHKINSKSEKKKRKTITKVDTLR